MPLKKPYHKTTCKNILSPTVKEVHNKETSAAGKLSPCKKAPERMFNGQVDTAQWAEGSPGLLQS